MDAFIEWGAALWPWFAIGVGVIATLYVVAMGMLWFDGAFNDPRMHD